MTLNRRRKFTPLDSTIVDGVRWHTISTNRNSEVSEWIRSHPKELWQDYANIDMIIDVHEKLYTLLLLKWYDRF
jgi:hypothetical protein